jgi:hypothetical protein
MLLIDGKLYESQELPTIYFGESRPLSYVLNPKAACTLALHFVFFLNHNYRYFNLAQIHFSRVALRRLHGPELDPVALRTFFHLIARNLFDGPRSAAAFCVRLFPKGVYR